MKSHTHIIQSGQYWHCAVCGVSLSKDMTTPTNVVGEIKRYRVRNTRNGVELLRLYNAQEGWKTIKDEGFDNHKLLTGMTIAIVNNELRISPAQKGNSK